MDSDYSTTPNGVWYSMIVLSSMVQKKWVSYTYLLTITPHQTKTDETKPVTKKKWQQEKRVGDESKETAQLHVVDVNQWHFPVIPRVIVFLQRQPVQQWFTQCEPEKVSQFLFFPVT